MGTMGRMGDMGRMGGAAHAAPRGAGRSGGFGLGDLGFGIHSFVG